MLNKETLLKIFDKYKNASTGGIYMTKWDAMADDILSSQNAAKPIVMRRQSWVCNSCGFSDYTDAVTEQELKEWLQCSNCGGDEFHLEPVIGGA